MKLVLMVLLLPVLAVGSAIAEERCRDDELLNDCWDRVRRVAAVEAKDKSVAEAKDKLEKSSKAQVETSLIKKNTGLGSTGSLLGSTVSDFLSQIAVSADSGNSDAEKSAMTLELNNFLGLPVEDGYKLQAVLHKPGLFEPLRTALDASSGAGRADQLEHSLNDTDDTSLSFSWSPMTKTIGRNYQVHADLTSELFTALGERVKNKVGDATARIPLHDLTEEQFKKLEESNVKNGGATGEIDKVKFSDIEEPLRTTLLVRFPRMAALVLQEERLLAEEAASANFFKIADLINNQPQFLISTSTRQRDELVGPEEYSARISYEKGWVNMNGLRDKCQHKSADKAQYLDCFSRYVQSNKASLERGDRLSISLEYSHIKQYELSLPADNVALAQPSTKRISADLGYGRYFDFDASGDGRARIDVIGKYENFSEDPARNNRGVVTATLTRKISDTVALAFGLSYANRPEFAIDTDKDISAHVGLNYKLVKDPEK